VCVSYSNAPWSIRRGAAVILPSKYSGYDTYLSRCHSPCESINRSPMFGCNGSCYVFVLVYMSYSILFYLVLPKSQRSRLKIQYSRVVYGRPQRF
jgi:hypothetical protein